MTKYRKKPVVIEATQWSGNSDQLPEMAEFFRNDSMMGRGSDKTIEINTLEGKMIASPGDFIIRGIKGELYPCKPDIFEQTYEQVND